MHDAEYRSNMIIVVKTHLSSNTLVRKYTVLHRISINTIFAQNTVVKFREMSTQITQFKTNVHSDIEKHRLQAGQGGRGVQEAKMRY